MNAFFWGGVILDGKKRTVERGFSNGCSGWNLLLCWKVEPKKASDPSPPKTRHGNQGQPISAVGTSVATLGSASFPSEGRSAPTFEEDGDAYSRIQGSRRSRTARSGPSGILAASHVYRCVRRTDGRRWTARWIALKKRKSLRWTKDANTYCSARQIRSERSSSRWMRRVEAPTSGGSTVIDGRRIRVGALGVRQVEGTKRFLLSSRLVFGSNHVVEWFLTLLFLSWIHSRRWAEVPTFSRVGEIRG